ncbi:MAG: GrpB family protein [Actinobacteria bacterium]|nr:GrpB family protein [Actinomycetota bacterium]
MVADEPAVVTLVPYDPAWPRLFEAERAHLELILDPWLGGGAHHVGSTAIPGMSAKPVIDMIAGVHDLEESRAAFEPLAQLGYEFTPHRPRTHHFSKPRGAPWSAVTHNLHLTEVGTDLWRERLAFRDALRADPMLAAEYDALKRRIAAEYGSDPGAYTVNKRPFVARVLAGAGIQIPAASPR